MSTWSPPSRPEVVYPDSDGRRMADNTRQWDAIAALKQGFQHVYRDRPDVFVGGDLLWYPVEGDNKTRIAPDVLVAEGRPKGYRGSYKQWVEGGIAPQLVIEVLSPGNRPAEMKRKLESYERFGVEEYYVYDPDRPGCIGYLRAGDRLTLLPSVQGWISPRTGVRFDLSSGDLRLFEPDGKPFRSYEEIAELIDAERQRAERLAADADAERQRVERLAAQLRALGIEPDA